MQVVDDISSIETHVISIVYHAIITLCGKEWKGTNDWVCICCRCSNRRNEEDKEEEFEVNNNNNNIIATKSTNEATSLLEDQLIVADENTLTIQLWRQELYNMVVNTITFRIIKNRDQQSQQLLERTKLYDIEIRTVMAYYQRYKEKTESSKSLLRIISDMGIIRCIHSAYQLSYEYILPIIEQQFHNNNISNHTRVAPTSSFICCISTILMQYIIQQQEKETSCENSFIEYNGSTPTMNKKKILSSSSSIVNWVSCPYCPVWCLSNGTSSNKGLWWHLQQQHIILHHNATEIATQQRIRNSTAIIVYNNNNKYYDQNVDSRTTLKSSTTMSDVLPVGPNILMITPNNTTTSRRQQQQLTPQPITSIPTNNILQPKHFSSDPWECLQSNETTISQFILCLQEQPSSFHSCTTRDKYGAVLLHWAAGYGHTDIVQYFIEQLHCPINIQQICNKKRSYTGRTPLHWAARNGHYYTVQYLLQYASSSNSSSQVSSNVKEGSKQEETSELKQQQLIECVIEAKTIDGTTPLGWAAWQGHLNIMQLLYQYGCQINTMNKYGCNAILWASQHPYHEPKGKDCSSEGYHNDNTDSSRMVVNALQWLVDVGCHFLVINHSGHGVLHKGAQRGSFDTCTWYLNQLRTLIENEQRDTLLLLLPSDFVIRILNVFGPNNDNCTPSDLAGMENHINLAFYLSEQEQQFVRLLIKKSYNPLESLPDWLTPLPKGVVNHFDIQKHSVWEPGGGVFRMRCALTSSNGME